MPGPYGDEGHEADHVQHRLVLRDLSLRDVRDGNETAVQAGKGLSPLRASVRGYSPIDPEGSVETASVGRLFVNQPCVTMSATGTRRRHVF